MTLKGGAVVTDGADQSLPRHTDGHLGRCKEVPSPPHVVVIGNQKGGSGKSTFAMHIIVALLKAGKRVASFDLDLNQQTLTRYLGNRRRWDREHEQKLELPDHYPVTAEVHGATLRRFISRLKKIGRAHKD